MAILLSFAPFIVFALVDAVLGAAWGLTAAASVSLVLVARDLTMAGGSLKVLELGTALLFSGLALATVLGGVAWSVFGMRLAVDAGLLAIVLISLAIRRPFTTPYARASTRPEF